MYFEVRVGRGNHCDKMQATLTSTTHGVTAETAEAVQEAWRSDLPTLVSQLFSCFQDTPFADQLHDWSRTWLPGVIPDRAHCCAAFDRAPLAAFFPVTLT